MSSRTMSTKQMMKIDEKYDAMQDTALRHIQNTKMRRHSKKLTSSYKTTSSPPIDDFVLFPSDTADEKHSIRRRHTHRKPATREKTLEKDVVAAADDRQEKTKSELPKPVRTRVPRHGGFRIMPMVDSDDEDSNSNIDRKQSDAKLTMNKPPPAPSPPKLDSPELSEVDEDDFWPYRGPHGHRTNRRAAA